MLRTKERNAIFAIAILRWSRAIDGPDRKETPVLHGRRAGPPPGMHGPDMDRMWLLAISIRRVCTYVRVL
jgi:hypothetical protein